MAIEILNIPVDGYIKQGDTIDPITFTFENTYDIDLMAVGVEVKMQVYHNAKKIIDIKNGSGITILSSKVFRFDKVEKENNKLPSGTFKGDLQITDQNGDRFTYADVYYTVIKEYTKN